MTKKEAKLPPRESLYRQGRRIIDMARYGANLDTLAEALQVQRMLLDKQPKDVVLVAVMVPLNSMTEDKIKDRYPLVMGNPDGGVRFMARDWQHEQALREAGYRPEDL